MNDKRVMLATALSAVFLVWYSQSVLRFSRERSGKTGYITGQAQRRPAEEITPVSAQPILKHEELATVIENESLAIEVGNSSADIRSVKLKNFHEDSGENWLRISYSENLIGVRSKQNIPWSVVSHSADKILLEATGQDGSRYSLSYLLDDKRPVIRVDVGYIEGSDQERHGLTVKHSWYLMDPVTRITGRYRSITQIEAVFLTELSGKEKYERYSGRRKNEIVVPRGTTMFSLSERYFCQSVIPVGRAVHARVLIQKQDVATVSYDIFDQHETDHQNYTESVYIGPRDYFYLRSNGFGRAFQLGILKQIGLVLLTILNWIASITKNYGAAIMILSASITMLMSPFTMISFKSMRKMQELKPKIDAIMKSHKNDSAKANKEVFELYKTHKVSPLSGCLPMVLQMPIFIALFQAISHCIELRGKRFLWVSDLSLPDRVAHLPISIPVIGNELNLLPILMATAMYVQTKMSQGRDQRDVSGQNQNIMTGPLMAVIFGAMFYNFPSGLVLYWLTNTSTSLILYRISK